MSEDSSKKNEATPPFSVLLPFCTETLTDVFFNILKNAVARSKLDDHDLDSAFKSGMTGEEFAVNLADVSDNWKNMTTTSQQIIQSKLLGLWAAKNFPSIGKKLFGYSYQSPQRNAVKVNENSKIDAEEIDDFIFKKMKLRIIQLDVRQSTVMKLRHFVKVPGYVGKTNEFQISPKIKSFDVDANFIEDCWNALKVGEFPMNSDFEHQDDGAFTVMYPCVASTLNEVVEINAENISQLVPCKGRYDTIRTEEINDNSSVGSLREVVLQMRQDIVNLTKSIDNEPERLHAMVIKQKDDEIEKLKRDIAEKNVPNDSIAQLKLQIHELVSQLAESEREKQKQWNEWKTYSDGREAELAQLKLYATSKDEELVAANNSLSANEKFRLDLTALNDRNSTMVSDLHRNIQSLNENLAASETINQQSMNRNEELKQELCDLKNYAASKDEELIALNKLHVQSKTDVAQLKTQVTDLVEKLAESGREKQQQWNEWKTYSDGREAELAQLKLYAARKDEELIVANNSLSANKKLRLDLTALKDRSSSVVVELQRQIQSLEKKIAASETVNDQSIKRKKQLEQEICDLRSYAAKKDAELALFLGNQSGLKIATQTSSYYEMQRKSHNDVWSISPLKVCESADDAPTDSVPANSVPTGEVPMGAVPSGSLKIRTRSKTSKWIPQKPKKFII